MEYTSSHESRSKQLTTSNQVSFVKSHLLESWRASYSTSLTNKNLVCLHTGESRRQARREKLATENLSVCTGPLVKFPLVKSHLLESWRASFSTSLTSENMVCVHTARENCQGKLVRVYGVYE